MSGTMEQRESFIPQTIAEKVLELTEQFTQQVFEHPELLDALPDRAALIFLDADDPDFNAANLALAEESPLPDDSERVYIRMQRQVRLVEQVSWAAKIVAAPFT